MKKNIWGLLVVLVALLGCTGVSLAKDEEQVQMTVAPSFLLLDQGRLDKFNIIAGENFEPLKQKVFPGVAVNTRVQMPNKDLLLGTNTQVVGAVSESQDGKTLAFVAVGFTLSLEKPVLLARELTARWGGSFGYGISTIGAQFEKDGSLGDQLGGAKYSQAYEFYFLAGAKASLDYAITEKISLTGEAQYSLPLGSWGTKDFNLPLGGPSITVGVSFLLP